VRVWGGKMAAAATSECGIAGSGREGGRDIASEHPEV
jgi:hypothetical protein